MSFLSDIRQVPKNITLWSPPLGRRGNRKAAKRQNPRQVLLTRVLARLLRFRLCVPTVRWSGKAQFVIPARASLAAIAEVFILRSPGEKGGGAPSAAPLSLLLICRWRIQAGSRQFWRISEGSSIVGVQQPR